MTKYSRVIVFKYSLAVIGSCFCGWQINNCGDCLIKVLLVVIFCEAREAGRAKLDKYLKWLTVSEINTFSFKNFLGKRDNPRGGLSPLLPSPGYGPGSERVMLRVKMTSSSIWMFLPKSHFHWQLCENSTKRDKLWLEGCVLWRRIYFWWCRVSNFPYIAFWKGLIPYRSPVPPIRSP